MAHHIPKVAGLELTILTQARKIALHVCGVITVPRIPQILRHTRVQKGIIVRAAQDMAMNLHALKDFLTTEPWQKAYQIAVRVVLDTIVLDRDWQTHLQSVHQDGIVSVERMLTSQWIWITLRMVIVFVHVMPPVVNARPDIIALKVATCQNHALVGITALEREIRTRQVTVALDIIVKTEHGKRNPMMV